MFIAVFNMKGGSSKTTTAVNLGAALSINNRKVAIIDLCIQGNATKHLGVEVEGEYDPFSPGALTIEINRNLRLLPADPVTLSLYEYGYEKPRLSLDLINSDEIVILDCPPAPGRLASAGIVACDVMIVPVVSNIFSLDALEVIDGIMESVISAGERPDYPSTWVLMTQYDVRRRIDRAALHSLRTSGKKVFDTVIHFNTDLTVAPGAGVDIFRYKPKSRGAKCYLNLCKEMIKHGLV